MPTREIDILVAAGGKAGDDPLVEDAAFGYELFTKTLLTVAAVMVALTGTAWPQTPGATGEVRDSRFAERFRQADANGDRVITEDEARAAGLWFTPDFNSGDTDRSGTVTLFELGQALQQRLSRWLSDFDVADADHDGRLTEDEARRVPSIADVFTTIHRNKDSTVSREEYQSYAIERLYRNSELPSVAPNIIEKKF